MRRRQKERFIELMKDPNYRHGFLVDLVDGSIASQIKVIRERRGYTQKALANLAGMKQSRISEMEDVNYGSWSVRTLRRLAKAFDVALSVRFVSFGKALDEYGSFSTRALFVPGFDDDPDVLPTASKEESRTAIGIVGEDTLSAGRVIHEHTQLGMVTSQETTIAGAHYAH